MYATTVLAALSLLAATASAQASTTTTTTASGRSSTSSGSSSVTTIPSSMTSSPMTTTSPTTIQPASIIGTLPGNGTWSYYNATVTSIVVVETLTTTCAEPTTLTFNGCEYTASTAGEVVTVTNCPCTLTTHLPTLTSSYCPPETTPTSIPPPVQVEPFPSSTMAAMPSSSSAPAVVQVAGASSAAGFWNVEAMVFALGAVFFGL